MRFRRILVPYDFSPRCEFALKTACELSKGLKSSIHVVHIVDERSNAEADLRARERLRTVLAPSQEMLHEVNHEVMRGAPHRAITQYARDNKIDLIVMGTRARTGLVHVTLGSIAERVMRSAPCPVTIVRADSGSGVDDRNDVLAVLFDAFGPRLEGSFEETSTILKKTLMDRCRQTESEALASIRELESMSALLWKSGLAAAEHSNSSSGHWQIDPEMFHAADHPDSAYVQFDYSDTPALDLLARAVSMRATDIHIDPEDESKFQVRFRIDGKLEQYCLLDDDIAKRLTQQFLTHSGLDMADPFNPREGRLRLPGSMNQIEARITTSPVAGGDAMAIRLFTKENVFLPLEHLGFVDNSLATVRRMLEGSEGLVLVTGPTGSGKTTAVYSMLETVGGVHRNIVSIEDPVEFSVPFVRQISVDLAHGLTMTHGLRTILRMDPDVVFVGEIRDAEAAEIAMRAASSGRFVFSTLHTRDVASTITAFRDLGIQDRSLAGNLVGIINQRLVRRLCVGCRRAIPVSAQHEDEFRASGLEKPTEIFEPVGCEVCRGSGYRGRTGVFEAAVCNEAIAIAITSGATESEIREVIRSQGTPSLTVDALIKVQKGITSFEEALSLRWL